MQPCFVDLKELPTNGSFFHCVMTELLHAGELSVNIDHHGEKQQSFKSFLELHLIAVYSPTSSHRILQWHGRCTPNPQWSQWSFIVVCMQECIFLEGSGACLYWKGAGFEFASPFIYRRFEVLSHFHIQLKTPSIWLIYPRTQRKIFFFQGKDWMVKLEMWFHLTLYLLHKLW